MHSNNSNWMWSFRQWQAIRAEDVCENDQELPKQAHENSDLFPFVERSGKSKSVRVIQ